MDTKIVRKFNVIPKLPERLLPLREIASNIWWCWDHDASSLLLRIDRQLWDKVGNNPIKVLSRVSQKRLDDLSKDESFLNHMERVYDKFKKYISYEKTWFNMNYSNEKKSTYAYFSAEFGLSETLPIYSGGLGILAGDHMKSASDMGLPLVGVGLLYKEGYFRQYLNADGWQQETYPENEFFMMPVEPLKDEKGEDMFISIELPDGICHAKLWKIRVGRIDIYMMDTNIPQNTPEHRLITARLYGGDTEMRIKQEILLGIGGMRALYKINKIPTVTHMNEGHSAFLAVERIRVFMKEHNLTFYEAKEAVIASSVFTTHTPVPAGNDRFSKAMIEKYFNHYVPQLGISMEEFLKLGYEPTDPEDPTKGFNFCMTVLALKLAAHDNGVSKLHGKVSRNMWKWLWPDLKVDDVPIASVTNGVHARTWISIDMATLFERYLGPRWIDDPYDYSIWERVKDIPSTELWHTHERRRERLVAIVRDRLHRQLEKRGFRGQELEVANEVLDPEALTIGFARRFATYKRATMLFRDPERLAKILGNKNRPIQFIFAGKAHPHDEAGKEFIKEINRVAKRPELRRHLVFLEDYDMALARYLVQGVDVWLNNPRRPLEASGTSGMKVCFNGGLNVSILDGWWDEAYNGENGWAIGSGEDYNNATDTTYQDDVESKALYQVLEDSVIPLYYNRGSDGLPKKWIEMMKRSMMTNCPVYNTNRMVEEYTSKFYVKAAQLFHRLSTEHFKKSKELSSWKYKIDTSWGQVKIANVHSETKKDIYKGDLLQVKASVELGNLKPDDVVVSIYFGNLNSDGEIINPKESVMNVKSAGKNSEYEGTIRCDDAGEFGYVIRVMADQKDLASMIHYGKVVWG